MEALQSLHQILIDKRNLEIVALVNENKQLTGNNKAVRGEIVHDVDVFEEKATDLMKLIKT